ncbi:hypothetical protein NQ023_12855 [Corynebacterium phoceense]|uniref:hypothetical protein n=1 Tax=Corynebacterium phoceense TaxID=1686286 RepID=UPI00211BA45E|nr:hypothetical protein [Corynebacterium phoceense]MCQ9332363.1 hypothetical protein [Corynebacterium phoceense]MCQ9349320.1 hypothetical protein [Corynebacterium phoceense]
MAKTVVLLRCTHFGPRESQISSEIKSSLSGVEVIPVIDVMHVVGQEYEDRLKDAPANALIMDQQFLKNNGLSHYEKRTGWVCGDYCLYAALDEEWDFAWIIEPDVYFTGDGAKALEALNKKDADLITTRFRKADSNWFWTRPLQHFFPDMEVFGILFPLNRISRRLADLSLRARREIQSKGSENGFAPGKFSIPNDESVIASVAVANDLKVLNIEEDVDLPVEILFSSSAKYCLPDLELANRSAIIHKGEEDLASFDSWVHTVFRNTMAGHGLGAYRLKESFKSCTREHILRLTAPMFDEIYRANDSERDAFFAMAKSLKDNLKGGQDWARVWFYKQLTIERTLVFDWETSFGRCAVDITAQKGMVTASLLFRNLAGHDAYMQSEARAKLALQPMGPQNRYRVLRAPWGWGDLEYLEQLVADLTYMISRIRKYL